MSRVFRLLYLLPSCQRDGAVGGHLLVVYDETVNAAPAEEFAAC